MVSVPFTRVTRKTPTPTVKTRVVRVLGLCISSCCCGLRYCETVLHITSLKQANFKAYINRTVGNPKYCKTLHSHVGHFSNRRIG